MSRHPASVGLAMPASRTGSRVFEAQYFQSPGEPDGEFFFQASRSVRFATYLIACGTMNGSIEKESLVTLSFRPARAGKVRRYCLPKISFQAKAGVTLIVDVEVFLGEVANALLIEKVVR